MIETRLSGRLMRNPAAAHAVPLFTQLGALCWRRTPEGPEVLLVTSSSGRWILPKGWPIRRKKPSHTVRTEAWEEAGVTKGKVSRRPVGSYMAIKRTLAGDDEAYEMQVFALEVERTTDDYPECQERDRLWVSADQAQTMVDEDGLRDILGTFARESA